MKTRRKLPTSLDLRKKMVQAAPESIPLAFDAESGKFFRIVRVDKDIMPPVRGFRTEKPCVLFRLEKF